MPPAAGQFTQDQDIEGARWRGRGRATIDSRPNDCPAACFCTPVLAEVSTYADLIEALVERRKALGLSQEEVDDRAGFQERYTSKIELARKSMTEAERRRALSGLRSGGIKAGDRPRTVSRGLGDMSMPTLLQVLGVKLVLVERDD